MYQHIKNVDYTSYSANIEAVDFSYKENKLSLTLQLENYEFFHTKIFINEYMLIEEFLILFDANFSDFTSDKKNQFRNRYFSVLIKSVTLNDSSIFSYIENFRRLP